jgi:hypothetical protein
MNNQTTEPKGKISMSEAAMYREYVDVVRAADPPRASFNDIELLSQTIAIRIWAFRTKHTLATVLGDGFFDNLRDVHLRKNDRIEVVASWDQPMAEHAALVVDQVTDTGKATVNLMLLYKRSA